MMMCSRCHKRPAVVFISQSVDASKSEGLCLVCAKELGIKPVNDLMDRMGITPEQIEAMEEELSDVLAEAGQDSDLSTDDFMPGGAATFPFLQNLFSGNSGEKKGAETTGCTEREKNRVPREK